eukprot:4011957-Pyramimonas_sp.AAC.1
MERAVAWDLVPPEWCQPVRALLAIAAKAPALHGLDVFAGKQEFCASLWRRGKACQTFESQDDSIWEKILRFEGLSYLFWLVLRAQPGGLTRLVNIGFTSAPRRQAEVTNERLGSQRRGERSGRHGVYYIVEHPAGSWMWKYQPFREVLQHASPTMCMFDMFGAYAAILPTPSSLAHLYEIGAGGGVNGRHQDLEASAAYTPEFCDAMVLHYLAAAPPKLG